MLGKGPQPIRFSWISFMHLLNWCSKPGMDSVVKLGWATQTMLWQLVFSCSYWSCRYDVFGLVCLKTKCPSWRLAVALGFESPCIDHTFPKFDTVTPTPHSLHTHSLGLIRYFLFYIVFWVKITMKIATNTSFSCSKDIHWSYITN